MYEPIEINIVIPSTMAGKRLDQALAKMLPEYSRARLQGWIRAGDVKIDKKSMPACDDQVKGGEQIEIRTRLKLQVTAAPEAIPLQIVFEDESMIIVNKPAGLVVHPGAGNPQHTLMNALLNHDQQLQHVSRAGIVHRLDKETTGLLIIARTPESHTYLVTQLQQKQIQRQYVALVSGTMISGGTIDQAIGRDPQNRIKMAILKNGRDARTHYRIIRKYRYHTQLRVQLETGRTHQIRVHMAGLNYPIVGDPLYGRKRQLAKGLPENFAKTIKDFPRQALHASALSLIHPKNKTMLRWEAPIPEDMARLIAECEKDMDSNKDEL